MIKLAINISLAVQMLAFCEGLLLAERAGIDPHLAAEMMGASSIGSPMLKARIPLLLDLPEHAWFDIELMHKDIRLARQAGTELATPLPSAAVAEEILTRAGSSDTHTAISPPYTKSSRSSPPPPSPRADSPVTRSRSTVAPGG